MSSLLTSSFMNPNTPKQEEGLPARQDQMTLREAEVQKEYISSSFMASPSKEPNGSK